MLYYNMNGKPLYVKRSTNKKMYLFFGPNPHSQDETFSWLIYPKLEIPTLTSKKVYSSDTNPDEYRIEPTSGAWVYYRGPSRWPIKINVECI